jgi:hypothetical protein
MKLVGLKGKYFPILFFCWIFDLFVVFAVNQNNFIAKQSSAYRRYVVWMQTYSPRKILLNICRTESDMIHMDRKKKMCGIAFIILFSFSLVAVINPTKAMVEVDFYIVVLREEYPEINELIIKLYDDYVAAVAEYGIQVNLIYPSVDEAWFRFFTGNYDIIDFPVLASDYEDSFESIIGTLEFYLFSGFFRYGFKKVDKLVDAVIKIRSLHDEYLLAEPEDQEVLFNDMLDKFHDIEELLYESQIFEVNGYFIMDFGAYKMLYSICVWFNSEPGNVMNNEDVRLPLSYLMDREQIAYINSLLPYPLEDITPTCHIFSWSQYHDTSLPDVPPLP